MAHMYHVLILSLVLAAPAAAAQDALAIVQNPPSPAAPLPAVTEAAGEYSDDPIILPSGTRELAEFLWQKRPLIIFADSPNDPSFRQQMGLISERLEDLATRDVVVLTDTDAAALTPLREKLRPRGFVMVLLGKDGNVYLRKPFPWSVREISRSIDKMPLRQQEVRDRR